MRALDRKLLRDLVRMRLQAAAIGLLVACGVSVAVMAFSAQQSLKAAQSRYYELTHFAEVFATAKRAPSAVAGDLARLDGVLVVDPRAVKVGLMQLPGQVRPASARLIALPDDDRLALNRLVMVQGRLPDPSRVDEAVALKTFLDAARVRLGDRVAMVIDGRKMSFKIVGSALSPEFVYLPGPASMLPDDAHQGVFWAPRPVVEKASGLGGAFSAVSLKLAPGASEPAVLRAVDKALAPYGGAPAVGRADQVSNKFQDDRIVRFGIMAWVIPPIFLLVAASLVHMVLGRMVEAEREQIGLLKAFGYRDLEVAAVYLKLAALIGLGGAMAGALAGGWMGAQITGLLAQYMRFPKLEVEFSWAAFVVATAFSVAAALTGSLLAVLRAARLSPAVAMQPQSPPTYRKGLVERLPLWRRLDQPTRMILRGLERAPGRAALTTGGLGASLALLVGSQLMFGSFDEIIDQAYFRTRHWTEVISFVENRAVGAVYSARRLPGVFAAEPVRLAAIRVRASGHEQRAAMTGLDPTARLELPLDRNGQAIPLKGRGVVLSESLAIRLGVRPGDAVEIEVSEGRRPRDVLPVTALAQDYAGLSAFIARDQLNRLMGDGDVASGANLLVSADHRAAFYRAVLQAPQIAGSSSRADTVSAFRSAVTEEMNMEMSFFLGFAGAIAFGVAYNVSRVALADRGRDLATFRVLGFGRTACAYVLLGELLFLALLAVPLGILGGLAMAQALVAALSRQEMQIPLIVSAHSFGVALLAYLAAVLAAAVLVAQRVWSLDLVAALKIKE